jgi:hypothetical protein
MKGSEMTGEGNDDWVIKLCGIGGACCPTLEFGDAGVVIRDDDGGRVRLSQQEWAELVDKVRHGELA